MTGGASFLNPPPTRVSTFHVVMNSVNEMEIQIKIKVKVEIKCNMENGKWKVEMKCKRESSLGFRKNAIMR